jgi:hypothetical protein
MTVVLHPLACTSEVILGGRVPAMLRFDIVGYPLCSWSHAGVAAITEPRGGAHNNHCLVKLTSVVLS